MSWQICIEVQMPVWIPDVDITRTAFLRTSFKMLKKKKKWVVFKQECPVQVICSRDANHIVFVQEIKQTRKAMQTREFQ